jgi:hypothetical protein
MIVKLDVFHGLQRISKTVKTNKWVTADKTQFHREIRLLVRKKGDQGDDRLMATECAEVIKKNFEDLLQRWPSLNPETVDAILALKEHSQCLADIPVGGGTHRNEGIHKGVNTYFKKVTSISLEPTIALLTTLFIRHNRHIYEDPTPLVTKATSEFDNVSIISPESLLNYGLLMSFPGNGAANIDNQQENYDDLVQNVQNFINVKANLDMNSVVINPIEVLLCCPLGELCPDSDPSTSFFSKRMKDFHMTKTGTAHKKIEEAIVRQFVLQTTAEDRLVILKNMAMEMELSDLAEERLLILNNTELEMKLSNWLLHEVQSKCPQKLANFFNSVIIILVNTLKHPIHSLLPTKLRNKFGLFIVQDCEGFFNTKRELADQSERQICNCGKNGRGKMPSCLVGICPCTLAGRPCTKLCHCLRCSNPSGIRIRKSNNLNGCKCGTGANNGNPSCNSLRCTCLEASQKCSLKCKCSGCENVDSALPKKKKKLKRQPTQREGHHGKLKRNKSEDLLIGAGLKVRQSRWMDPEIFTLYEITRTKRSWQNTVKIKETYDKLRKSQSVLTLRKKSFNSIRCKLKDLNRKNFMYNQRTKQQQ